MRTVGLIGPRGVLLRALVPETRRERMLGLLGRSDLDDGEALLLERSSSIHTFGMRFPITVARLDRALFVRDVVVLRPGRLLLPKPGTRHALECAAGTDLRPGDRLRIADAG